VKALATKQVIQGWTVRHCRRNRLCYVSPCVGRRHNHETQTARSRLFCDDSAYRPVRCLRLV